MIAVSTALSGDWVPWMKRANTLKACQKSTTTKDWGSHELRIDLCDMGELNRVDRGAPAPRCRPVRQRLGQHDVKLEAWVRIWEVPLMLNVPVRCLQRRVWQP